MANPVVIDRAGTVTAAPRLIVGHAAVYGMARVAISGLDLLFTPLYARALSPSDFGLIAIAISLQAAVGIAYTLGLDGALFRLFYFPTSSELDKRRVAGGLIAGVTCVSLFVASAVSALGPAAFGGLLGGMSGRVFSLVIWGSVFNVYPLVLLQLLQIRQESPRYLMVACWYAFSRGVTTVLMVMVLQRGAEGWAEAFAISTFSAAVVALVMLRSLVTLDRIGDTLREAVPYAIPQLIHQVSGWLAAAASRPILGALLPLSAVAVYQVAFGIGQSLGLVTTAVSFAYGPAFMEAANRSESETGLRFGRFASLYISLLILLAGLGSLWRDLGVRLIAGPNYAAAAALVPIVLTAFALQGVYFTLVGPVFLRKESVKHLPVRTILSAAVGLSGIVLLVPYLGVAGAAWAMLGANLVLVATVYPLSQQSLQMQYDHRMIANTCLVVGTAVSCSYGLQLLMDAAFATAGIVALTCLLAFYAVIVLCRDAGVVPCLQNAGPVV